MATPGRVDYQVHYHIDGCSDNGMTFENIAAAAVAVGLDEICVVKHYTTQLPNGEARWVFWKRVIPEQFEAFLADGRRFLPPEGLSVLLGTESEILDDRGTIAIGSDDRKRVDTVLLSAHWLPEMAILPPEAAALRGRVNPYADSPEKQQLAALLAAIPTDDIVAAFADCYARAVGDNPEARVLAHMGDGLRVLRAYGIDVDALGPGRCADLMMPVMQACVDGHVLWELTAEQLACPAVVRRADELGVRFSATADAHSVGALCDGDNSHAKAEAVIDAMGLTRGVIRPDPHDP